MKISSEWRVTGLRKDLSQVLVTVERFESQPFGGGGFEHTMEFYTPERDIRLGQRVRITIEWGSEDEGQG